MQKYYLSLATCVALGLSAPATFAAPDTATPGLSDGSISGEYLESDTQARAQFDTGQDQQFPEQQQAQTYRSTDRALGNSATANFTETQRTAAWRFVEREGRWWYRTPHDRWMVHQDGQWRPYHEGRVTAAYRGVQHDTRENASSQTLHNTGTTASECPQTTWMCIDGRMRKVTIISERPVGETPSDGFADRSEEYTSENSDQLAQRESNRAQQRTAMKPELAKPASDHDGYTHQLQVQASEQSGSDYESENGREALTPPPVPQPRDEPDADDLPEAPSRELLMQSSAAAATTYGTQTGASADLGAAADLDRGQTTSDYETPAPGNAAETPEQDSYDMDDRADKASDAEADSEDERLERDEEDRGKIVTDEPEGESDNEDQ